MDQRIFVASLFDGIDVHRGVVISVCGGLVKSIDREVMRYDETLNGTVIPGFIDVQVNGGGGLLFNSSPTIETLQIISTAHAKFGTVGMLPTVITDDIYTMRKAADAVSSALKKNIPGILGIHFEGPHISKLKKGAHSDKFIRGISSQEWKVLERKDLGHVLVTLAPECVDVEDIKRLVELGVIVSIGHSNASFDQTMEAIEAGATGFTHLFNAMSPLTARESGVTGAALLSNQTQAGIIADGHHVSTSTIKLALKCLPLGGVFLVTDAMPTVGSHIEEFEFFDRQVFSNNGQLRSTTGELAGSNLDMISAVKNCIHLLGISFSDAVNMASLYPLKFLNKNRLPIAPEAILAPGQPANFVQLDHLQNVVSTWVNGACVYDKNKRSFYGKQ